MPKSLTQEIVLGSLLGMAIGDALGMPFEGELPDGERLREAKEGEYLARTFPDGAELQSGEFTDESEFGLCIVETFTSTNGELDPDIIRARFEMLALGESRRWMNDETVDALVSEDDAARSLSPAGDVAVRGVPLGLINAGIGMPAGTLVEKAEMLANLTHDSATAKIPVVEVAEAVRLAAERQYDPRRLPNVVDESLRQLLGQDWKRSARDPAAEIVSGALEAVGQSDGFLHGVWEAVSRGGPSDARGAITGAILGAYYGTEGIPQGLIDGLEGRMYVLLAGPWFYRTIQLKSSPFPVVNSASTSNESFS